MGGEELILITPTVGLMENACNGELAVARTTVQNKHSLGLHAIATRHFVLLLALSSIQLVRYPTHSTSLSSSMPTMSAFPPDREHRHCIHCLQVRHLNEFLPARAPLQEIVNDAWNQPGAKLVKTCRECREKRKPHDAKRKLAQRQELDKSRMVDIHPWAEVLTMLEQKTIDMDNKQIQISDLYRHLPAEVSRENQKDVAQFVVEQFATVGGYQFYFHHNYMLSKKACGRTTLFANASALRFRCSQNKSHNEWVSTQQYGKTRNRQKRIQIYDCDGEILVYFPAMKEAPFDIVVENKHPPSHPGRDLFGVPLRVRQWIQRNPRTTPQVQREDLIRAIERGELAPVQERHLRPVIIHYWWRKGYKEKEYISDDFWINIEHILRRHPRVCTTFFLVVLIFSAPMLFSLQSRANI